MPLAEEDQEEEAKEPAGPASNDRTYEPLELWRLIHMAISDASSYNSHNIHMLIIWLLVMFSSY